MKKLINILIIGIIFLSCKSPNKQNIDSDINSTDSLKKSKRETKIIMTSSADLEIGIDTIINNIKFTIVEKEKENPRFWSTRDINFKTPEGYSVGNELKDISEKDQIYKEQGFGYFIKLKSGWRLGFCEGETCTDYYPTEKSVVKWIMKKK